MILTINTGYHCEQHWRIGLYSGDGSFLRGTGGIFIIKVKVRKIELHSTALATGTTT